MIKERLAELEGKFGMKPIIVTTEKVSARLLGVAKFWYIQ